MEISDIGDQVARAFALEEEEEAYDLEKGQGRKKSRFSALGKQVRLPRPASCGATGEPQLSSSATTGPQRATQLWRTRDGPKPIFDALCPRRMIHPHPTGRHHLEEDSSRPQPAPTKEWQGLCP
eukprot:617453-Pelagomonas_calceolata.AAC.8